MPRQLWLPEVLRKAGLKVAEQPGWQTRGSESFAPVGVMWHHTATGTNWSDTRLSQFLADGRSDLAGPLCHLQLNRDGSYVVIASGRANHAGSGQWKGITAGNTNFIGIEAANDGVGESWSEEQLRAYYVGTAAIIEHINGSVDNVIGHKEWTTRKIDPRGIDMNRARQEVSNIINKKPSGLPSLPENLEWGAGGLPDTSRSTLRYLDSGRDVKYMQERLLAHGFNPGLIDGEFGPRTLTQVHKFQTSRGLVRDGIVGKRTWSELEKSAGPHAPKPTTIITSLRPNTPPPPRPAKFNSSCTSKTFRRGSRGNCVSSLQRRLNSLGFDAGTPDGIFGPKTTKAVKEFQSHRKLLTDGVVGPKTWSELQK